MGISQPDRRARAFPHELSGGERQRVVIAIAIANDPDLIICDEPTTALDVTVQAEILKLMRDLKNRIDAAIVLITHDMGVVADMADRVLVMKDGIIVESGTADEVFNRPIDPYTVQLLNAVPHLGSVTNADELETLAGMDPVTNAPDETGLTVKVTERAKEPDSTHRAGIEEGVEPIVDLVDIAIEYPKRGRTPAFRAVEGVTLQIGRGEVMGLVGESGSGKTTIGRALVKRMRSTPLGRI